MHTVKRLLTEFIPEHYTLSLIIDRPARSFTGTLTVTGESVNGNVMLHGKDLTIHSVTVNGRTSEWQLGDDDEITIAGVAGKNIATISYSGKINNQLHGLYPCKYEYNGEQKELLATQFESHYAREVFPCVDEPSAKATFDITLTTEKGVTVLGNMPVKSSTVQGDTLVTSFETTPKMSSYLVAFVIGDLQKRSAETKGGVKVNVYATPAQPATSLDFALHHAVETIEFFNDYFGVPYPLPKSDQVALPDFSNGAMENWGLITYRESCLLYDENNTSLADKQYISTVISHELSHQWFGNLVTMAWWDDLWLNESFATIMEYLCVDALHPDWNLWLTFNITESMYALQRDSLGGVQSVKVPVHHPDEIQSVFDGAIVYAKGARLMQMMRSYVGEDAFKAGLHAYFTKHQYDNTKGSDLWNALSSASGKNVGEFMEQWLAQSGYPMLHVESTASGVKLMQQQFLIGPHAPSTKLWPIPLSSTCSTLPAIFSTKEATFACDDTAALRMNTQDTGHYITQYSPTLFAQILDQIKRGDSTAIIRAQIIKEQALLAKSPEASSATLVDLLNVYKNETNEKVWGLMSGVLGDLKKFVDPDTAAEHALKQLASSLASSLYKKLGWQPQPGESEDDTMLRSTIIGTMLYAEDAETIEHARTLYKTTDIDQLDPELRSLVLIAEVRHGDTNAALQKLLQVYKNTASVDLKNDICDAVTSVREPSDINMLLGLLTDTSLIRTQDTAMWYVRLLSNRYARTATWDWLRKNWDWIQTTFGGDKSYDAFPRYSAQILATRKQLNEYKAFFEPMLSDTALKLAVSVGINDITARVELIEADKQAVEQKLVQQQ